MESEKVKSTVKSGPKIKNILITQPRPESEKSPYFELEKKYKVHLEFAPFIEVEGIPAKEFRRQKIDLTAYTAVIFASRNAIEHFFRTCEEMRITVSPDTKYFCITESVALYLQKFILYRKRKVFFGADGTNKSLFDEIEKFKDTEKFLYPCSESFDSEITNWLIANKCTFAIPILYKVIFSDVKAVLQKHLYDIICFFTPLGVKSFVKNCPNFKQKDIIIGAFGDNTRKAVITEGMEPNLLAPFGKNTSMVSALENYLTSQKKK